MIKVKDGYAKLISTTFAGSADRVLLSNGGDFGIHTGRNNEANKLVRTDASGYIQAGWINTTSGNFTGTPTRIYASNDEYIRYMTPANFLANVVGNNYWKVNGQTTAGTGDIYLEMWRGANASWKMLNTGGVLKFQSNYTSSAGSYFDVLNLEYNSGNAWLKGYLTATGFIKNGSSSAYALTGDGGHKQWTTSSSANTLVARDANQYIYATYYNSNISNEDGITLGSVYVRNNSDNWIRRMSFSKFVENITNSIDSRYIQSSGQMIKGAYGYIPTYNGETGWHRIATIDDGVGYGSWILYLCGNWSYAANTSAIVHIDTMHTSAKITQVSGIKGYVSNIRVVNVSSNKFYVDVYIDYSGANTPGTVYFYFLGNGTITTNTTAQAITTSVTATDQIALRTGGAAYAVHDAGNKSPITFQYSSGGYTSNPSYLAAWNGYHITYVAPAYVTVGAATLASTVTVNSSDNNATYRMVWHSGNTLYGTGGIYCNPSSDYLYAASMNASDWFRSSGNTGWYNPTNSCHVYPNATTTYGGLMLRGEKGGYTGFILGNSTNYMNLMDNGTDKGLYQEGKLWILYYNRSSNYVGIRTSSLSDPLTIAGITRVVASDKYLRIGPQNSSHAHYETNASVSHWFNKTVQVDGNVEPYGNNEHSSGSSSNRWSNVYSYLGNFAGTVTISCAYPNIVCNASSGSESNIRFDVGGANKGYVGFHNSYGTFLYNSTAGKYVYVNNNGYFYTQSYINVGAGNEKNASNPPYVWGVNGSDNFMRTYATSSLSVNYANSAGSASSVTINYNNNSNSTYQMLWGSGNYVYGTSGIYCNPYYDILYAEHHHGISHASSWLAGQQNDNAAFLVSNATDTGSYWPWMRQTNTGSGRWFSMGVLANSLYFIGSTTSRTENSYDHGFRMDFSNGYLYGNFSGYLSGTASYATTAGTANSVAWANVTGKPSIPSFAAKGSATKGVYLSGTNTFAEMTHSLNATVNAGYGGNLAYYSGTTTIGPYTSTIGGTSQLMYLNAGVPTNSTANVGLEHRPIYMYRGIFTQCTYKYHGYVTWGTNSSGSIVVYQFGPIVFLHGYITKINQTTGVVIFTMPSTVPGPIHSVGWPIVQANGANNDRNTIIRISSGLSSRSAYIQANYTEVTPGGNYHYISWVYLSSTTA